MELQTLAAAEVRQIHEALVFDFAQSKDPISPIGIRSEDLLLLLFAKELEACVGQVRINRYQLRRSNGYGKCVNSARKMA